MKSVQKKMHFVNRSIICSSKCSTSLSVRRMEKKMYGLRGSKNSFKKCSAIVHASVSVTVRQRLSVKIENDRLAVRDCELSTAQPSVIALKQSTVSLSIHCKSNCCQSQLDRLACLVKFASDLAKDNCYNQLRSYF